MRLIKRPVSIILTIVMLVCMIYVMPTDKARAADSAAYYILPGQGIVSCEDAWVAWNRAVDGNGTFGLFKSWRGGDRRIVPDGKTVTVELNGYVISRDLYDDESDGEVFYVGEGSVLNVYGGTEDNPDYNSDVYHEEQVYAGSKDRTTKKFYGGMIHGGYSSNGAGGIHMKNNAKVNLYYTTVAGNRAESFFGDGYGGGVCMDGENCRINMDHSSICYNYAEEDGGGVYVDEECGSIYMKSSHIDYNTSCDNGGGIYANDEYFRLEGDAKQIDDPASVVNWDDVSVVGSTVSHNYIADSDNDGGGGGIFVNDDKAVIKNVTVAYNKADGSGDGGGVYFEKETCSISNCNIIKNTADDEGGGLIIANDKNTVENCTIYGNYAGDTGAGGGGLYVSKYVNVALGGKMIVVGNSSADYSKDNLYLSGYASSGTTAFISGSVSPGSMVNIRLSGSHMDRVSLTGTYDDALYGYDNDSSKHIEWDRKERALYVRDGSGSVVNPIAFVPDEGKTTQSVAGGYDVGGKNYELIKGIVEYPSNTSSNDDLDVVFYYSDGYFMGDSNEYNPHLATASLCLAGAAGYSIIGGNGDYLDKSNNFRQFMSDIGCKDENIYVNDFNTVKPTDFSIGVGIASKELADGRTLIIIGVRGMGYESEWVSNMTLGTEGEGKGWDIAASHVMSELETYLENKGIDAADNNTVFWISGFSRAGATANLTAKRIIDKYNTNGSRMYAYPMEPPKGGLASKIVAGNNYNCIHNVINQNDIVPWVGPSQMGFIRYGVDHYVPGSVTTNASNTAIDLSTDDESDYVKQRNKMLAQLTAVNSEVVFDDYYHAATINYILGDMISETSDSDMETVEEFIPFFFEKIQEYGFYYDIDNPRNAYSGYVIENGKTFEQAAAVMVNLIMGKSSEDAAGIAGCLSTLIDRMDDDMFKMYKAIRKDQRDWLAYVGPSIGWLTGPIGWALGIGITAENIDHAANGAQYWEDIKTSMWNKLTTLSPEDEAKGYHRINEYMTPAEVEELHSCFDSLMFPIIGIICADYADNDQDILGTMAYNASRLITNHYQEVVNAWLRSYDSFYENDKTPVYFSNESKRNPSEAAVMIISADGEERIVNYSGGYIEVAQDELVRLVPSDTEDRDTGEAIYYRFTTGSENAYHAFDVAWNLSDMEEKYSDDGNFEVETVATHYDRRVEKTIKFVLKGDAVYETPDEYLGTDGYSYVSNIYHPNAVAAISGVKPAEEGCSFEGWKVYPITDGVVGTTAVDPKDYPELFGDVFDPAVENTFAKNLTGGSYRFVPFYITVIDSITVGCEPLMAGVRCVSGNIELTNPMAPMNWKEYDTDHYTGFFTLQRENGYVLSDDCDVEFTGLPGDITKAELVSIEKNDDETIVTINVYMPEKEVSQDGYCEVEIVDANTLAVVDTVGYFGNPVLIAHNTEYAFDITAPDYPDMEFIAWEDLGDISGYDVTDKHLSEVYGYELPDNNTLRAYYAPIVKMVTVTLDSKLTAGEPMPAFESLTATISHKWSIDNAVFSWSKSGKTAGYDTVYTAEIAVDKATMTGRDITAGMEESIPLSGKVLFADDILFAIVDKDGNALDVNTGYLTQKDDALYLTVVFNKTATEKIVSTAAAMVSVPHGSDADYIVGNLPSEVAAFTESGKMVNVPVTWSAENVGEIDTETTKAQTVTAYGTLEISEYDTEGVMATAYVTIHAAEQTSAPVASPVSGKYNINKEVTLTADEGATIYYATLTTDPDAVPPILNTFDSSIELDYHEYTEPIIISDNTKKTYIYTYASKDGLCDSDVVRYSYCISGKLFVAHSLTLNGSIGLNFYLDLTDEEAEKTTVSFEWFDKELKDVPVVWDENAGYYRVSCPVAAAEMTYEVTATATIDGVVQEEIDVYSVKEYADVILSDEYEAGYTAETPSYENLEALVLAMLDYGARAQLRFDRNTELLANGGEYVYNGHVDSDEIASAASDMTENLSEYGLTYTGSTVVFLTKTSIRHYYKITDAEKFNAVKDNITFDGEKVSYTKKGKEIYFEKNDVAAANLDKPYVLCIGDNEYQYAVTDYMKKALENPDTNPLTRDLLDATYYYNIAADAYFGA